MHIDILSGEADLTDIERFRYQIYVAEQGKPLPLAHHASRRLPDALDALSTHFLIRGTDGLDGYGRLTIDAFPRSHLERAGLMLARQHLAGRFAYISNIMVAGTLRRRVAACRLMEAMFRWAVSHGVSVGFCHCSPSLVPLYRKLGLVEL